MSRAEIIRNNAVMILSDLAFVLKTDKLIACNLKKTVQTATFIIDIDGKRFLLTESTMSKANTYKAMLIVERNKEFLYDEWVDGKWVR
jgi:hypothetical protein